MARTLRSTVALTLLLGIAAGAVQAVATKVQDKVEQPAAYLPGGVADAEGKTGYLANPQGGIDAVNLKTGKLLWDTSSSFPRLTRPCGMCWLDDFKVSGSRARNGYAWSLTRRFPRSRI